jgi:hypothetical protein
MILLKNVPFERQVKFLHDNILSYPDGLEFDTLSVSKGIDYSNGLKAFHTLLGRLYSDVSCLEDKGDEKNYTELINTLVFLQTIFVNGTLSIENGTPSIKINKALLQKKYKKGNLTFRKQHIEYHELVLNYLSPQAENVSTLRKASELKLSSAQHPDLIPAVKYFADKAESTDRRSNSIYNNFGVFIKGDIKTALGYTSSNRDDLDPCRDDIVRTVDSYRDEWMQLVNKLQNQCKLQCSGFLHYHATPSWGVSFFEGRKKPLLIFTLGSNIVFAEFTVPVNAAEYIILDRKNYSRIIREKIERFHCVNCPKQCKGANIIKIDGVSLCTGRAEARRIYVTLHTPEDFASVHTMLDTIYV